jgi:hypothetical protein
MASNPQFFLKTAPLPGEPPNPYTGHYLRHHGSGINSIMIMPSPPKFIKAHEDKDRILFTSASHESRRWGLTLRVDGGKRAGWEKVEIVQDGGSEGWSFSGSDDALEYGEEEDGQKVWKGWMVCEWAAEHPQLFWVTDKLKGKLPAFCHRVQIVREML